MEKGMEEALQRAVVWAVLGLNSLSDLRKREIMLWPTVLCGMAGAGHRLWEILCSGAGLGTALPLFLLPVLPGLFLIVAAVLCRGKIGLGDGILVSAAGIWMDGGACVSWVMAAFLLASLWIILKCVVHGGRASSGESSRGGSRIPFVPFLLLSAALVL